MSDIKEILSSTAVLCKCLKTNQMHQMRAVGTVCGWCGSQLSLNETTLNASHSLMSPGFRQPFFSQLFVTVRPGKMPLNPTGNGSW